jgi:predicted amidohydrolase YtcJ
MTADLIIFNAAALTMDDRCPRAEAVAIAGNLIVKVGRNRDVLALKTRKTQMIDAKGATVMPGFIESHMHVFAGAAELDNLDLTGVQGFAALEKAVLDYAQTHGGRDLLIANQADYTIISKRQGLTRQYLDQILSDRSVLVFSPDHHTAWANTIALEQAGLLRGKQVSAGNEIVMGVDGFATGELREGEAIGPVRALTTRGTRSRLGLDNGGEPEGYPSASEFADDLDVMRKGLSHCAKHGITSFQNMDGNFYTLELLAALERKGELTARAMVPFHFKNFMPVAALERASAMAAAYRGDMLKSGTVKLFMDGVLDSLTAVMLDDYPTKPGWRGAALFSQKQFDEIAIEADRRGLQIAVHAIGDGAVRSVLDGYQAARKKNGARDSRHRVEHIEVVHPSDIKRFAKLGVIASMQPPHPPGSQGLPLEPTLSNIGQAKWPYAYAWNSLRKAGAHVVFGTDWPVSDINPIRAVQSAMTRVAFAPGIESHAQSLMQALHSYTVEGAYAEFAEGRKGQLKKGMLADVVVLSGDLEKTAAEELHEVVPKVTICNGRVVWKGDGIS